MSFAELRTENPQLNPPVIDGLLRAGETCNVISYSKIGKSWLMYGLGLSIISGQPWLGNYNTAAGKVLYIDNELHRSTLAHRIPAVASAMGIRASEYENDLQVVSLRGQLRSLVNLAADLESIEPGEFKVIVLDAKYRFAVAGVSENDNSAETALYNELDRIAEHTKAAIVLVHHASKGSQTDKRVTDVGAGAGAQSRAADCHIVLREHEEPGIVVLDAAVRSFPPVEPLALRWQFPVWLQADAVNTSMLKGRGTRADELQSDKDRDAINKIVDALRKHGPLTARQLRPRTGLSRERQERLLCRLQADEQLSATEITIRGNLCTEYSLPKDESPT